MSNQNKGRFSRFIMGKGFYVALAVCLAGAGTAAWVAVNNTMNQVQSPLEPSPQVQEQTDPSLGKDPSPLDAPKQQEKPSSPQSGKPQTTPAEEKQNSVKKPEELPAAEPSSDSSSASSSANTPVSVLPSAPQEQSVRSQTSSFVLPMNTPVMAPFSGDQIVENITLREWRTHNGVDLSASLGDPVRSASDGKVTSVSYDPLWGTTVEITDGDLVLTYCGLNEQLNIKINDHVRAGDNLGTIGEIPCELALDPHLHFTVTQDSQFIDPLSLISE